MTTAPTQAQIDATVAEAPNQSKWLWAQVVTAIAGQLSDVKAERDEAVSAREAWQSRAHQIAAERDEALAVLRDWMNWTTDPKHVLARGRAFLARLGGKATP